jgi:thioredoxin-related protein
MKKGSWNMKYILALCVLLICGGIIVASGLLSSSAPVEGDELRWNGYSDAVSLAKEQNKKVLVDVFTTWCGWCKKMDKDVYADAEVKAFLDKHFIIAKLNAESAKQHKFDSSTVTEAQIARAYGITGYPATVFLTNEGKAITVIPGYIKVEVFKNILAFINDEAYKTTSFDDYVKQRSQKQ